MKNKRQARRSKEKKIVDALMKKAVVAIVVGVPVSDDCEICRAIAAGKDPIRATAEGVARKDKHAGLIEFRVDRS